jgi:hypothetical protein
MIRTVLAAGVAVTLAATPAFAQGNSQSHKKPKPAPSSNSLSASAPAGAIGGGGVTTAPFAWVDDATLLPAGSMAVSISTMRWSNGDLSEVDAPIVAGSLGVSPRVQLSASVPRVSGAPDADASLGTVFLSGKVGVYENRQRQLKVAVSPTLQLLSPGVVEALGARRVQFGLPVSAEIDRGQLRLYGSTGYFSTGTWFGGAGATLVVNPKTAVSIGFSRAWRGSDVPDVPLSDRDRNELSGAASYSITSRLAVFGSVGRTIATLDENGAGTTVGAGLSVLVPAAKR